MKILLGDVMNISDNGYRTNNAVNNVQGREQSVMSAVRGTDVQGTGSMSTNTVISANSGILQMAEGQVFHGQILNVTNSGEVNIGLDNNSVLLARMADAVNLNIGDSINFLVKENDGNSIVIKPYTGQEAIMKDSAIFKALKLNNLAPTEKNYSIAEKLMNNSMPLDRAGMQKIMQQSYKYPNASLDTLVSLNKLGIPVNEANISQYDAYMNNSHQLANDVNRFANSVTEFSTYVLSEMTASTSSSQINDILLFQDTLLGAISDETDAANIINIYSDSLTEASSDVPLSDTPMTESEILKNASQKDIIDSVTKSAGDINIGNNQMSEVSGKLALGQDMHMDWSDSDLKLKEATQHILNDLSLLGFSGEDISMLVDKSGNPMQFLNNINTMLAQAENLNNTDKDMIKGLLTSEEYREIFKEAIVNKFTINGKKLENPKEVDDLYQKMYDKTTKIMSSFSEGHGAAGQNLRDSAKGMQERLDFMQNLNEMFTYAQIPVSFSGNDVNSELFVYMNKKRLNENREDVSALLHLDMEHLGATDVHVSLHGTTVHTRFYVEDEESAVIIDEHMNMLEKSINERGFSLTNEVVTRELSVNSSGNMVVNEMLGTDLEKTIKRYSFDVRT